MMSDIVYKLAAMIAADKDASLTLLNGFFIAVGILCLKTFRFTKETNIEFSIRGFFRLISVIILSTVLFTLGVPVLFPPNMSAWILQHHIAVNVIYGLFAESIVASIVSITAKRNFLSLMNLCLGLLVKSSLIQFIANYIQRSGKTTETTQDIEYYIECLDDEVKLKTYKKTSDKCDKTSSSEKPIKRKKTVKTTTEETTVKTKKHNINAGKGDKRE